MPATQGNAAVTQWFRHRDIGTGTIGGRFRFKPRGVSNACTSEKRNA
jgi:hypothetical protein